MEEARKLNHSYVAAPITYCLVYRASTGAWRFS